MERACALAATSNTLPDRLGEGRFAADDFLREIQGLAAHFDVLRRGRGGLPAPRPARRAGAVDRRPGGCPAQLRCERAGRDAWTSSPTSWATWQRVHPSRYGAPA